MQGFYKLDGELLFAPNEVLSLDYHLISTEKDNYTYPVGDWYWFDSEEKAKSFFNIN